jgi:putative ABC transport system permease protein
MSIATGLMSRLRTLAHRRRADAELDDEIRFHIELETEQNLRAGLSAIDARRLAVAKFGGVQRVREDHRDVRRLRWIEDLGGDLRFALRVMRRTPVLTIAMIATVALAVGADISVFSAFEAVLIRPLPFPGADRMLMVTEENPERHWHLSLAAMANYFDWRDGVPAFEQMTAYVYSPSAATLTTATGSRRLRAWYVDGNFFNTLGVRAELGRTLRDDETWDSAPATVVLSHAAWIREFGGAPSVIGRTITLDTKPVRVVGVMPATFAFPDDNIDLWQSFRFSASDRSKPMWRDTHWLNVIARLRPGVSKEQAATQLGQVATRLQREYPATNQDMSVSVTPLQRSLTASVRLPLQLLFAAVTVLLMIACANVGNLMLVQAVGRRHEVALRLALGAERGRLARQALAESLMLTTIGVALGVLLGWAGTHSLVALQPEGLLRVRDIGTDRIVWLYAAVLAAATGLVLGAAPAVWARTRAPTEALNDRAQGGAQGRGIRRWTDLLVIGEVALALTIAASAGLFARSFWHLIRVDPGFDARGVLTASVAVGPLGGSEERLLGFDDALLARARALPGVTDAAMAGVVPLSAYAEYAVRTDFIAEGRPANEFGVELALLYVSPSYFQTMRIPLRRGRVFGPSDGPNAPPVVIINEALARTYFAGRDPIGQRLIFQRAPTDSALRYTIIGVPPMCTTCRSTAISASQCMNRSSSRR